MKIEGSIKTASSLLANESRPKTQASDARQAAPADAKVEISSLSSSLGKAEAAIASTPTVDRARVAELRQAISEGRFKMDANRIADGLLASVREMLEAKS
ncbi:MAG TPA: flagellar biosynthesis anti-sigma factor FlgM [Rhodocyclaceae bacterium]|nr:flagellar biosynthesis anti-sigma factor FlgM [Rhodocyclaceae bacterium]